eukprot:8958251-Ditylum_brightwellii.AAC.1
MNTHQAWSSKTANGLRPGDGDPLFLLVDAADARHQEQPISGSKAATNAKRRSPPSSLAGRSSNKREALEQDHRLHRLTQQGVSATSQISKGQGAKAQVANSSRESVTPSAQDDAT